MDNIQNTQKFDRPKLWHVYAAATMEWNNPPLYPLQDVYKSLPHE